MLSLLAISPFLIIWKFWLSIRADRQLERGGGLGRGLVSDVLGVDSHGDPGLGADLEKGLVEEAEETHVVEGS